VDTDSKDLIAFELFQGKSNTTSFVFELRRASNDTCGFFALLNKYKELYKAHYDVNYPF
jgi:hypothetical protein